MVRAARALAPFLVASALAACLSYPELETVEARDASVMPERPAQPIARTEDAGDAGTAARAPDADAAAARFAHAHPDSVFLRAIRPAQDAARAGAPRNGAPATN
jgi:hypothetical protein